MKVAIFYCPYGSGHLISAKAINEAFCQKGHDSNVYSFFSILKEPVLDSFFKDYWRVALTFPNLERYATMALDSNKTIPVILSRCFKKFKKWFEKEKPDCIISTILYPNLLVPAWLKKMGVDVPVYGYNPDTFFCLNADVNPDLTGLFCATQQGVDDAILRGMPAEKSKLCKYPIRKQLCNIDYCEPREGRVRFGNVLDPDKFTIMLNLGGEGIGAKTILKTIQKLELDVQIIILGNIDAKSKEFCEKLSSEKHIKVLAPGYVLDVMSYVLASDILIGKPGPNAMAEAFYAKRPYMLTYLMAHSEYYVRFMQEYQIGWYAKDSKQQYEIITSYMNSNRKEMLEHFAAIPLQFDSGMSIVEQILEDFS